MQIIKDKYKFFSLILIYSSFLSFFIGFYFDESSNPGSVDLDWIKKNIEIFLTHDLFTAITHPDYFGNRTPLLYALHALFNPFLENIYTYRVSVFVISLLGPFLFYLCLKQKYKDINKTILLLIASTICLSPYYRTSAFWGLEENYAIICLLLSFLSLNYFLDNKNENGFKIFFQIFILALTSSACIYFDQKFLLVPLICFLSVIFSKKLLKFKIFLIFSYFFLALPFIYLIVLWEGIVPTATATGNANSITKISRISDLYFPHIGYATTIIAFYLFPFLIFIKKNIQVLVKDLLNSKTNYFLFCLFFLYLFYLINFFDYEKFTTVNYWIGLGYIHKIFALFKNSLFLQKFLPYSFFCLLDNSDHFMNSDFRIINFVYFFISIFCGLLCRNILIL